LPSALTFGLSDKLRGANWGNIIKGAALGASLGPVGAVAGAVAGARAGGGGVHRNRTYLVGEHGPELFTPGSSGGITPNHRLGGGGGVHVGAINIYGANDPESTRQIVRQELTRLADAGGSYLSD
jgi:SLT domain-containing protein